MKDEERYLSMLTRRGIQPTAIRLLVLDALAQAHESLSLADLDNRLDTVDKSTIYRTLTLFLAHRLIHSIDDGTGSFKYALCADGCTCQGNDLHAHFHCERCNRTFCFTNLPAPLVSLPEGFSIRSINYVLKGLCPECAAHNRDKG